MAKSLVIVESPAKAKTINRYLGSGFVVKSSMGHIIDLPAKEFGVDLEHDFKPKYVTIKGKQKILNELAAQARKSNTIYLATDPDREGEAISWHLKNSICKDKKVFRVLLPEITSSSVKSAFDNTLDIKMDKVNAQQARRILDRVVGYKISPVLWKKVGKNLSAGRVQSVTVRIIIDREREIEKFKPEEYWSIIADLKTSANGSLKAKLSKLKVTNKAQADKIVEDVENAEFAVSKTNIKTQKRSASPPFITSRLQQEASSKLHFSSMRTMRIAQQLYEGIETGKSTAGLITYMRTDSVRVSAEALKAVRNYIKNKYGEQYLPPKSNFYKSKKSAQDAHEAIRPTSTSRDPETIKKFLTNDQFKLYKLIWNKFVASQMSPAIIQSTAVEIKAGNYIFTASGSTVLFLGYMAIRENDTKKNEPELPLLKEWDILKLLKLLPEQHFTKPPSRYTEGTLIRALDEKGIGRPSTYAPTINTIQNRKYVTKIKGFFHPTNTGVLTNNFLIEKFSDILDIKFTADMESFLDLIENGEKNWIDVLKQFYARFEKDITQAETPEKTDVKCEKCGKSMVIRWRFGKKFYACTSFPECRQTKAIENDDPLIKDISPQETEHKCEKCGSSMLIRTSRRGPFLACSGYPKCKNTKSIDKEGKIVERKPPEESDQVCEKCGSKMLIKTNRRGQKFLACGGYPKCKNAKPLPKS
ncbi:type I DNA topoisomerase [bacterium]|nr:type I DNA topoisomerase [bacterium]